MSKFSQRFFLLRAVSPILGLYAQFGRMGYQRLMPVLAERLVGLAGAGRASAVGATTGLTTVPQMTENSTAM